MAWRFSRRAIVTRTEAPANDLEIGDGHRGRPRCCMQRQVPASTASDGSTETLSAIRVLAISGSLRDASTNSALIRAAAQLAPFGVQVEIYGDLAQLPPFNPDLDIDP